MGGYSQEAEVSYKSGQVVMESLDRERFTPYPIHITKEKWFLAGENGEEFPISKDDFSVKIGKETLNFDCVFNAIHGTPGEDGFLQAYFKLINLPITGASMYSSALTFNKRDLLSVMKAYGVKVAKSYYINQGDAINPEEIIQKVGLPCFVKANKSGSSFGVYKVYTQTELVSAIENAFEVDSEVLIEAFLDGTEVSVGVIRFKGEIKVLPITEIVPENDFFDYEAKYLGKSQEITPARLSPEMEAKINKLAKRIYKLLQMSGFTRSEFIIVNSEPHLLEMNTTPGLSRASILPQQAQKAGISLSELFASAIEEALKT